MPDHAPAFPIADQRDAAGYGIKEGSDGLTKREWFAGQALAGAMAGHGSYGLGNGPGDIAARMYEIADAMLVAPDNGDLVTLPPGTRGAFPPATIQRTIDVNPTVAELSAPRPWSLDDQSKAPHPFVAIRSAGRESAIAFKYSPKPHEVADFAHIVDCVNGRD